MSKTMERFEKFLLHTDNDLGSKLGSRITAYREDEPETLRWIEGFDPESVFYDIGSNVGGFSFYAALHNPDLKIYSFEPNFVNFYTQQKTILNNGLNNIAAYNIAVNNKNEVQDFFYKTFDAGHKGTFGTELKDQMMLSDYGNPHKHGHARKDQRKSTLGLTLDTLIYDMGLPEPTHLKIDVDGNDLLVLKGAEKFLKSQSPVEVFVEIDEKIYPDREIQLYMESLGGFEVIKELNVGTASEPMNMTLYRKE